MSLQAAQTHEPAHDAARELIAQRAQLQDWLERLDQHGGSAPDRVIARVRADYAERLRRVSEELSAHLPPLRETLAALQAELSSVDARRAVAEDDLAELRLRHLIGELDDGAWTARRPELEQRVAAEDEARTGLAHQVSELVALLGQIDHESAPVPAAEARSGADPAPQPAAVSAEPVPSEAQGAAPVSESPDDADAADAVVERVFAEWEDAAGAEPEPLPWLGGAEEPAEAEPFQELEFLNESGPAAGSSGRPEDDDLAFLKELDRAIAGSRGEPAPRGAAAPEEPAADAPKDGLVCKECGAANDPRAWYCEICGMELT